MVSFLKEIIAVVGSGKPALDATEELSKKPDTYRKMTEFVNNPEIATQTVHIYTTGMIFAFYKSSCKTDGHDDSDDGEYDRLTHRDPDETAALYVRNGKFIMGLGVMEDTQPDKPREYHNFEWFAGDNFLWPKKFPLECPPPDSRTGVNCLQS